MQMFLYSIDARWETSAAWQQAEMSNKKLSDEVGNNANVAQAAARQAAAEAQVRLFNACMHSCGIVCTDYIHLHSLQQIEPQVVSAINQLEAQRELSGTTTQAANQGKLDVEAAKGVASNTAAIAVEQAKNLANGAYATAQVCQPCRSAYFVLNSLAV